VKRFFKKLLGWLLLPVLLFEEWGWHPLARLMAIIARLPGLAWLEERISQLPPWGAMLVFTVPFVTLLPLKIFALYLFSTHHVALGTLVLLAAKVTGTAILARLFQLTQPALMQLSWFAKWYPRWKQWKDHLLDTVRASELWWRFRTLKKTLSNWITRLRS
jgi:hypothetical protein